MGEVIACYKDNSKAFGSGFHIAGTKYLTIKADDRSLYGKQVSCTTQRSSCLGENWLI